MQEEKRVLVCPSCGAPAGPGDKVCRFCGSSFVQSGEKIYGLFVVNYDRSKKARSIIAKAFNYYPANFTDYLSNLPALIQINRDKKTLIYIKNMLDSYTKKKNIDIKFEVRDDVGRLPIENIHAVRFLQTNLTPNILNKNLSRLSPIAKVWILISVLLIISGILFYSAYRLNRENNAISFDDRYIYPQEYDILSWCTNVIKSEIGSKTHIKLPNNIYIENSYISRISLSFTIGDMITSSKKKVEEISFVFKKHLNQLTASKIINMLAKYKYGGGKTRKGRTIPPSYPEIKDKQIIHPEFTISIGDYISSEDAYNIVMGGIVKEDEDSIIDEGEATTTTTITKQVKNSKIEIKLLKPRNKLAKEIFMRVIKVIKEVSGYLTKEK